MTERDVFCLILDCYKKKNNKKYHTHLASYFSTKPLYLDDKDEKKPNIRKLVEQPWQQTKAEMWDEVTETLCDVLFIEAQAIAGMLDDQQKNYKEALSLIPDSENKRCLDDFYTEFLRQKHVLKIYPKLTFQQMYNQLQWSKGRVKNMAEQAKNVFLSMGRNFLHQLRVPETHLSHLIMTFTGQGYVKCCAFLPDGKLIVFGSLDKTLILWDTETGKEIVHFSGRGSYVSCCAFSPDLKRIVTDYADKLKLWDAVTGKEIVTLSGHSFAVDCCAFSPDGKRIVSGSRDKTLKLWDTETGKEIVTLSGHSFYVSCCAFSPDGKQIVSGSRDKTLKLWDAVSGKEIATLSGHIFAVNSCAFSPNGQRIISGDEIGTLKLWDARSKKEVATIKGHGGSILCCAFSPDGKMIVSGNGGRFLELWDVETYKLATTLSGHNSDVHYCTFSPDGKKIVSGSWDRTLKLWDAVKGKEKATLSGRSSAVDCCAFSPNGKLIITTDKNTLKIWDVDSGKELITLKGHSDKVTCCAFSPDWKRIVSGSEDETLKLWDACNGKEIATLTGHSFGINCCAFSPSGKRIVSGSTDDTLKLWDAETGEEIATLPGHIGYVNCCTFSPDGKLIISGCRISLIEDVEEAELKLWDARNGAEIATLTVHSEDINCCDFSPNGQRIISGSRDGTLKLWDARSKKEVATMEGYGNSILCCAFSPDGKNIVSGSEDGTLKLWDAETGKEITTLKGHSDRVNCCSFSPDGKQIFSGSDDTTVKYWDTGSGKEITTFCAEACVRSFSFHLDSNLIACGDSHGNFYLIKLVGIELSIPIVTGVRIYLMSIDREWDNDITAVCPFCGVRFPCFVPDNATFDDSRLIKECPECGKKLKFNPFIVDNSNEEEIKQDKFLVDKESIKNNDVKEIVPKTNTELIDLKPTYTSDNTQLEESFKQRLHNKAVNTVKFKHDNTIKIKHFDQLKVSPSGIFGAIILNVIHYRFNQGDEITIYKMDKLQLGYSIKCNEGVFTAFNFTNEDNKLLTATDRGVVSIWDLDKGKEIKTYHTIEKIITAISISMDSRYLIIGFYFSKLILWDLHDSCIIWTFKGHTEEYFPRRASRDDQPTGILDIIVSPDGKYFFTLNNIGEIFIWNLLTGQGGHRYTLGGAYTSIPSFIDFDKTGDSLYFIEDKLRGYKQLIKYTQSKNAHWEYPDLANTHFITFNNLILSSKDRQVSLTNINSGNTIKMPPLQNKIEYILKRQGGFLIINHNYEPEIYDWPKEIADRATPIVTMRKIWDYNTKRYEAMAFNCPVCGYFTESDNRILDKIEEIQSDMNMKRYESLSLDENNELWQIPELLTNCSGCNKELRVNPFIAFSGGMNKKVMIQDMISINKKNILEDMISSDKNISVIDKTILKIEKTNETPFVLLNAKELKIFIKGILLAKKHKYFFTPILIFIDLYFMNKKILNVHLDFECFDKSGVKSISNFLNVLNTYYHDGVEINLIWHNGKKKEDMIEVVGNLNSLIDFNFTYSISLPWDELILL